MGSNQPHAKLTKEVMKFLKKLDMCRAVKIMPGPYSETGVVDVLCCYRGQFVAIELKVDWDVPTPSQLAFLEEVRDAGGRTAVCYSLEEVKAVMV
jgi:hypothetical protein